MKITACFINFADEELKFQMFKISRDLNEDPRNNFPPSKPTFGNVFLFVFYINGFFPMEEHVIHIVCVITLSSSFFLFTDEIAIK